MTHSEFHHLLSSVQGLSPAQVRQLRQQLDKQLAEPKKPAPPESTRAAKRAKAAPAPASRTPSRSFTGR